MENIGDTSFKAGNERERSIPGFILLLKAGLSVTCRIATVDDAFTALKNLCFSLVFIYLQKRLNWSKEKRGKI